MTSTKSQSIGPLDRALYLANRALRTCTADRVRLWKYQFWVQPVPGAPLLPRRPAGAVSIRELRAEDPAAERIPRPHEVIAARFAQGGRCLGAFRGDELVGFIWFNLGAYEEDEVRATYAPGPAGRVAWDYDLFVVPAERGGLLFARLWDAAYAEMRASGCGWTMSRISSFNAGSIASHARLGGRAVGWGVFVRCWRWQLMVSSVAPRLHLSRGPGSRPRLALTAS